MSGALTALARRELSRAWDGGGGAAAPAAFFVGGAALAAFGVGPDPVRLAAAAPGVLTLLFLVVGVMGLEHLFQEDLDSGALDLAALGPAPLEGVAAAKILARASATLVPTAVIAPVAAVLFGLSPGAGMVTGLALALAAPGVVGAGAAPAAIAAGRARGGLLIAVMVPPLLAPVAIFAAGAIGAASTGGDPVPALLLTAASALVASVVGAFGAAAAIKAQLA